MVSNDDKKADVLNSLVESCWKEFDTRRAYEWKVSFGLWTALGIIAGFALKETFVLPFSKCSLIMLLLIIFIAYCWFQYGLNNSNTKDQDKRHFYINSQLLPIIGIDIQTLPNNIQILLGEKPPTSKGPFFLNWSHGSQILITAIFLLLLGLVLYNKDLKTYPVPNKQNSTTIIKQNCNACYPNSCDSGVGFCKRKKYDFLEERHNYKHKKTRQNTYGRQHK